MHTEQIEKIRKHYRNQWLLIKVTTMDESTTTPLKGRLLAHNPDRDYIFKKSMGLKGLIYIDYSGDKLPKGYAVAF